MSQPNITSAAVLIIGTADTKSDELSFLRDCLEKQGSSTRIMDVGVLGEPALPVDYSKHDVATAADTSNADIIALGDENLAMIKMAEGASRLAKRLHAEGEIGSMIALGGSMGTDLALDVAMALPLGVPKFIVSTISYSHLIPPQRLAPDLMMILWSGGLYGINSICKSVLSQAAGAVSGAQRQHTPIATKPKVGITSFGKSVTRWMVRLVPELEQRGFEAIVFHATGMGGRAYEAMSQKQEFVAVFDFAIQEVSNEYFGSAVTAGPDRLTNAGRAGIPQIVAPGCLDLVDFPGWNSPPLKLQDREMHAHNRLLSSAITNAAERIELARIVAQKLATAQAPCEFILPTQGIHEWDREGGPLRDVEALDAMNQTFRDNIKPPVVLHELDCHINDDHCIDTALGIFDNWVLDGTVNKAG